MKSGKKPSKLAVFILTCTVLTSAKVIDTINVQGLANPAQAPMVRMHTRIQTPSEFDSRKIQEAIKRLYYLGLFRSIDIYAQDETDSTVSLLVEVEEYPSVMSIEYSGNKKLKEGDLEEVVTIRKGQTLTGALEKENILAIEEAYAEKGYLRARVECEQVPTKTPAQVIAKFNIKENEKVEVEQITFVGNAAFSERKLMRKFKTKEKKFLWGGDFDEELYEKHLDTLMIFYHDEGYLDAKVVQDTFWYADNKEDIYITVTLDEGKRFYRGDIFFAGNNVIESDALKAKVALKRGKPFHKTRFLMTKEAIAAAFRDEGYLWVQVRDERAYRNDTIDVTFNIVEGVPAIVRKVDIRGNTKTRDKVIRREIDLLPGRKFRQSYMVRSMRDIMQLGYFDNVDYDMKPNDDGTVDFVFEVTEKENIGQLQVGAAFSPVDGFVGTFQTSIPNFRGAGQKLDLQVEYGENRRNITVGFTEPWAFNTPTLLRGSIFYSYNAYNISNTNDKDIIESGGFEATSGRRLAWPDDYFSVSATYRISKESERITEQTITNIHLIPSGLLSRLSFTLRRDDTDLPHFPNKGSVVYFTPQFAGLGGEYNYIKATAGIENYYPLFWKVVLGTKAKFGIIEPFLNETIDISQWDLFS
ncbi:MAG: outer membrane protein assembly factor BamA, partial [Chitinivibrionales bacterium]|nr:outer membrane protein assembly factor BamA [Chitinivibrionales bacterium]